jgi:hypothetical protein
MARGAEAGSIGPVKLQLLSDLHLETEPFDPEPAPGAELLVLAGDIDSRWTGYERFKGWPVPVIVVAGNHEFDERDVDVAAVELRRFIEHLGFVFLERDSHRHEAADGRVVHFLGTTRWSDFNLLGAAGRERAERAAAYFQRVMKATRGGRDFDAAAVREEGLACRAWLEQRLEMPAAAGEKRVVITHFAPSLKSADPRYGPQPGTASFCNADDDLIPRADLWLHGHLHCRHDYTVARSGQAPARVVSQARGLVKKGEHEGFEPLKIISL